MRITGVLSSWLLASCIVLQLSTGVLQVIVVNYEDRHTTMEAPDEDDESSYK